MKSICESLEDFGEPCLNSCSRLGLLVCICLMTNLKYIFLKPAALHKFGMNSLYVQSPNLYVFSPLRLILDVDLYNIVILHVVSC